MNKHVPPEQVEMPILTPAERVEALMDSFLKHRKIRKDYHSISDRFEAVENLSIAERDAVEREEIWEQHDKAIHAELDAGDDVVSHVATLMGDGLLERFAEFLRAIPTGP